MKHQLLLTASLAISILSNAQQQSKTYAITGKPTNNFYWADIKEIDVATGNVVRTLFEAEKTTFKARSLEMEVAAKPSSVNPTGYGVAALALDSRHNRLYFAPMHFSEIRYLDLNSAIPEFVTIKTNIIPVAAKSAYVPEESQLSRMAIAADGFGYAISNDGNHLIRFSTGKKPVVQNLGNLIDAESNKGISLHNKCTGWGGDVLADAYGRLVLISAAHNIFVIDVHTRIATYKGTISGLPSNYTTNGAVADAKGNIIVSSANVLEGLYAVDYSSLKAVKVQSTGANFTASDLANANMLLQNEKDAAVKFGDVKLMEAQFATAGARVYPNPVHNSQFNVSFDQMETGKYTIVFADLSGRQLLSKIIGVVKGNQVEQIQLNSKLLPGTYMIKVLDQNRRLAFSEKLVVM
ncbi:MAG TPA: T9SS type A sorting domain-containing protein [Ferruginibacter sp.]|nr:T9SS type A sorting domain-containing protein [Ferruginibacter sp.]HMP20176.1 T9SS type A sorting domain-containing protein [Ferruginibacter sp.]